MKISNTKIMSWKYPPGVGDDDDENLKLAVYNEHFGNNTISYP